MSVYVLLKCFAGKHSVPRGVPGAPATSEGGPCAWLTCDSSLSLTLVSLRRLRNCQLCLPPNRINSRVFVSQPAGTSGQSWLTGCLQWRRGSRSSWRSWPMCCTRFEPYLLGMEDERVIRKPQFVEKLVHVLADVILP